jgi:hypothetical protein
MNRDSAPAPSPSRSLLTVRQFSERYPAFSQASLRWLIFQSTPRYRTIAGKRHLLPGNGLNSALVRLGRRVLLDEARFFDWMDRQQVYTSQTASTR